MTRSGSIPNGSGRRVGPRPTALRTEGPRATLDSMRSADDRAARTQPRDRRQCDERGEAIFESFSALRNDLEQARRAMQRVWAKREKQIDRVLANTVGLHGDMAGIIGGTLPEIAGIKLKALAAEATCLD